LGRAAVTGQRFGRAGRCVAVEFGPDRELVVLSLRAAVGVDRELVQAAQRPKARTATSKPTRRMR
jgi:hypothetical protein